DGMRARAAWRRVWWNGADSLAARSRSRAAPSRPRRSRVRVSVRRTAAVGGSWLHLRAESHRRDACPCQGGCEGEGFATHPYTHTHTCCTWCRHLVVSGMPLAAGVLESAAADDDAAAERAHVHARTAIAQSEAALTALHLAHFGADRNIELGADGTLVRRYREVPVRR